MSVTLSILSEVRQGGSASPGLGSSLFKRYTALAQC
jgi:hypothetical protein